MSPDVHDLVVPHEKTLQDLSLSIEVDTVAVPNVIQLILKEFWSLLQRTAFDF
jgi:hypothetical protein